ncbi:37607_t:CDS:2 [Gigaspora margarita]|uniref:37607_t:CDS:1 n=1 Tax=Gigaspora margarita TaxID=4874 RepID=A0ABN7U936_GIGMA|nr:37607_t:CDS:2 [Gigaspora margarita]
MPLFEPTKLPQKIASKLGTKRGLLLSEHQNIAAKKKKNTGHTQPLKQIVNTLQSSNYKLYKLNLPKFMQEHVLEYIDMTEDGNCKLCTVAVSIGKSEDYWPEVQKISTMNFVPTSLITLSCFWKKKENIMRQHFVAIKLKLNVLVPLITNGWKEICVKNCKLWKNLFLEKIAHFKKEYDEERNTYKRKI